MKLFNKILGVSLSLIAFTSFSAQAEEIQSLLKNNNLETCCGRGSYSSYSYDDDSSSEVASSNNLILSLALTPIAGSGAVVDIYVVSPSGRIITLGVNVPVATLTGATALASIPRPERGVYTLVFVLTNGGTPITVTSIGHAAAAWSVTGQLQFIPLDGFSETDPLPAGITAHITQPIVFSPEIFTN
jgi:hypothetical protein